MEILAEAAVRSTVLAFGVALVLRALRIRSARLVHAAWTSLVFVMLLMPAFVAWAPELAVPLLPREAARVVVAPSPGEVTSLQRPTSSRGASPETHSTRMTWVTAAVTVYVVGVAFLLLRLAAGLWRARLIRRGAVRVQGRLAHPVCVTPMTIGVIAPAVVLPPDWTNWDAAELSAVIAHEEEHVRRRDPLVATAALVNRAVFWFHPLTWWLQREIARLAEQACDAAVISAGHDSDAYAACLLRFARRTTHAGGRITPIATAMPGAGLQERLEIIAHGQLPRPSASRLACAGVVGAALLFVCVMAAPTAAREQNVGSATRGQAAWVVHTSEHFEIFHEGLPGDRVSGVAQEAEAAYTQLSAALKFDMPRRVPIVLLRGDRDINAASGTGRELSLPGSAAGGQRLVISLESIDRGTRLLVHELTHQFAFEIVPRTSRVVPVLIEGLAEHQRGTWTVNDLRLTREAAAARTVPSVADLGPLDRHWAHAVFDYVAAQYGDEGVRRLLFALRAHETLVPALSMAFGTTPDQFDQGFRSYATSRFVQP